MMRKKIIAQKAYPCQQLFFPFDLFRFDCMPVQA